ncbi:hypothetical protein ACU6TU_00275 [Halomonas sp. LS-001]
MSSKNRHRGVFYGAPGMARSALTGAIPEGGVGVKVPCTPGKGKC